MVGEVVELKENLLSLKGYGSVHGHVHATCVRTSTTPLPMHMLDRTLPFLTEMRDNKCVNPAGQEAEA